jgi:ribosome-binding protein aMBF1 (putative translation factor)
MILRVPILKKPVSAKRRFNRTTPASAPLTLATAPKPVAQPRQALVTFRLTESQAAKLGFSDRWEAAMQKRRLREQKKMEAQTRLNASMSRLLEMARAQEWSHRQLAAKAMIPETTFRRILNSQVNPQVWVAKLETALSRLKQS